jgi:hypothetical protein
MADAVWRAACAGAALFALAGGIVAAQRPFADSVHEFGIVREFEGWIAEHPYPMLRVERPGAISPSSWLLVARGKHGAAELVRGLDAARVRVRGTLIYRAGSTMVELAGPPGRLAAATPAPPPRVEDLGERELSGEIVDSKCFLGVMKPGEGKIHRACAARCLSGGLPPLFLVRGESGWTALLLTAASGGPADREAAARHAAEPLRIRGRLRRIDEWLVLAADPAGYERLE